jgi:hypothetical protein
MTIATRLTFAFFLCTSIVGCAELGTPPNTSSVASSREDILVLRSVREARDLKSTWCTSERAGFAPVKGDLVEDRFTMWSVQSQNGKVINAKLANSGPLRTCFGTTTDPAVFNFYAQGELSGMSVTGSGDCRVVRADFPEQGIFVVHCYLNLRGLPSQYVGGLLTTSSLVSKGRAPGRGVGPQPGRG